MPNISFFSTNGSGLTSWDKIGSLHRELAVYKRFAERGWGVSFYTYDRCSKYPLPGFSVNVYTQRPYLFPKRLNWLYYLLLPILRIGMGRKTDVIMTNQAHGGWPGIVAGRVWGAKTIARCGMVQGECTETLGKRSRRSKRKVKAEKWTFQHADKCVVPTKELAEWVSINYKIGREKISIIPNHVEVEQFQPDASGKKEFDVMCVGRLVDKKRHKLLLESLSGSGLKIHFIGDGKLREKLSDFASKNSLHLQITDRIEHDLLSSFFNRSKIYVNVSKWEGHPKAMVEAMACGCACVGAKSPGIENLLIDGQTGILVDPEPSKIRSAIDRLLEDGQLRERLGKNARDYAVKHFSLEKVFEQYNNLFNEVLNK